MRSSTSNGKTSPHALPVSVVVLGMHRSGTSMMGGVLEALGVDMGEGFKPGARANPIGFFEDENFLELNKRILHAAGGDMHLPPAPEDIQAQKDRFRDKIRQLVQKKTSEYWGWKDPRTSLTIELFIEHLPNPHLIVCQRDIEAIAKSLQKRGDMSFDAGVELTSVYRDHLSKFFSKHPEVPRLEVPYEKITQDTEPWVQKIIDFLELEPTKKQRKQAISTVLPKYKIQILRLKRLIEKGIKKPWKIPEYVMRRLRYE